MVWAHTHCTQAGSAFRLQDDKREDFPFSRDVGNAIAKASGAGHRVPGIIAALIRGDELIGIAAAGVRKIGVPEPVQVNDLVHLGSCGKAITATMLGTVVDAGRLAWNSTLGAVCRAEAELIHPDYRQVTLDQLLRHTAGLPADVVYQRYAHARTTTLGRREILTTELKRPPKTVPGSTFAYSNLGYCVAALMAEQVMDTSWENLIQQSVLEPLGMTTVGFGPPGSRETVAQPWGHMAQGSEYLPSWNDNPLVMGPAGTVHLTMPDWARFAIFHLGDGRTPGGKRLLTPETLNHLHTPDPGQEYAGGWLVSPPRPGSNGPLLDHGGSNTLWFAYIVLVPGQRFGALVACNGGGKLAEAACLEVANSLLKLEPATRIK